MKYFKQTQFATTSTMIKCISKLIPLYKLEGARVHISAKWIFTDAPFSKKFSRGHVCTVPGNMQVKFEVRTFNHFGVISI